MFTPAQMGSIPPTPSIHRLQCGLPGYLILFAPHTFAPQRQLQSSKSPSHWCSSQSLRISPLHWEFHLPLLHSSYAVSKAIPTLKAGLSLQTYLAAYTPFTPNHSGQRLPPTYYRGCWHVVSRGFLLGYRLLLFTEDRSLRSEDLLPSRGVAGSGFPPLPNIPTAASRRSLDRLSVPMWPITLSGRLPIVALVGRHLTN